VQKQRSEISVKVKKSVIRKLLMLSWTTLDKLFRSCVSFCCFM